MWPQFLIRDKDGLSVVLQLFDGVTDIAERAMVAGLFGGRVIDLGVPATSQLFNGGNVNGSIMQVVVDRGQEASDESPIYRDRVAGQWRLSGTWGVLVEVLQDLSFGLGEGDTFRNFGDQPRTCVHLADEIIHLVDRLLRGMDDQIYPLAEDVELRVGDQNSDFY